MKQELKPDQTKQTTYIQLRNLPAVLHEAAKVAAARQGISLNQFFCDAIKGHVFAAGLKDKAVAAVLDDHSG